MNQDPDKPSPTARKVTYAPKAPPPPSRSRKPKSPALETESKNEDGEEQARQLMRQFTEANARLVPKVEKKDRCYNQANQSNDRREIQCLRILEIYKDEQDCRRLLSHESLSCSHLWVNVKKIQGEKLMKKGFKLPNPDEVLAKRKAKKRRSQENVSVAPIEHCSAFVATQPPFSQEVGSSHGSTKEVTDLITMSLPANSSIYSGAPNMLGFAETLLLPEDQCRYEGLGISGAADWTISRVIQGLSGALYMRQAMQAQEKRNQELFSTNAGLRKQVTKAQEKEKEWRAKVKEQAAQHNELSIKYESAQLEIKTLTNQLETIAINAMMKTRAQLMVDFKAGKSSEWDPDEAIELWREMEAEAAAAQCGEATEGAGHMDFIVNRHNGWGDFIPPE